MMTKGSKSKDKVKQLGEVFTPPATVFAMAMNPALADNYKNVDKPFFDPCCGEGQFPTAILVLKLFYNLDKLNHDTALKLLSTIYGMDIQRESIGLCQLNMVKTFFDACKFLTGKDYRDQFNWAIWIIRDHFRVGDSLEFLKSQNQQALF